MDDPQPDQPANHPYEEGLITGACKHCRAPQDAPQHARGAMSLDAWHSAALGLIRQVQTMPGPPPDLDLVQAQAFAGKMTGQLLGQAVHLLDTIGFFLMTARCQKCLAPISVDGNCWHCSATAFATALAQTLENIAQAHNEHPLMLKTWAQQGLARAQELAGQHFEALMAGMTPELKAAFQKAAADKLAEIDKAAAEAGTARPALSLVKG